MDRWWPFSPPAKEQPSQLATDPAEWFLGPEPQRAEVLPLLLRELESPAPSRRERAVELLAEAGAQEAMPALLALLRREEHLLVRWKALHALQALSGVWTAGEAPPAGEMAVWRDEAVVELMAQLRSESARKRWEAAEGLGRLGAPQAVPALVETLRDPHAFVRWAAAQALGQIGGTTAIPLLLALVQDPDRLVRRSAVDALGHLHAASVGPALRRALRDPDPTVCRNAIEAVARQGDAEAVESLASLLHASGDAWVRYSAAEALGVVGDHRAVAPLIEAAQDDSVLIRRVAVRSLGMLRDSRAIQPLVQALQDTDAEVRLHAADGLGRIGHEGIIPYLKLVGHDRAVVFGRQVGEAAQRAMAAIQGRMVRPG